MTTSPILGKPVHDMLQVRASTAAITVTSTPVEAKTGDSRMENRKIIVVYNNDSEYNIEYGFESDLTYGGGMIIPPGVQVTLAAGERLAVYLVAGVGRSINTRIIEGY